MSRSDTLMPAPVLGPPIFEDGDFSLHIAPWPDPLWEDQTGYMMKNNRYGTVEGVFGTESQGIREVRAAALELAQAIADETAEVLEDDAEFRLMMERLQGREE